MCTESAFIWHVTLIYEPESSGKTTLTLQVIAAAQKAGGTAAFVDAKREFGEVLIKVQKSPVRVTRNGKPIAVVLSDSEYQTLKIQALQAALIEGETSGDVENFSIEAIKNQLNNS